MSRICGRMVIEFTCKETAEKLLEQFHAELIAKGRMVMENEKEEEIKFTVDHHEVTLLFDEHDEQVV